MITGIYGINIAVKDLAAATATYERFLGCQAQPMGSDDFAFPGLVGSKFDVGGVALHLISYTDENTSIGKFVTAKGDGVFLVSVRCDDIDRDAEAAREQGLKVLLPQNAQGDFGAVNFIHPKSLNGVQFELYQPQA